MREIHRIFRCSPNWGPLVVDRPIGSSAQQIGTPATRCDDSSGTALMSFFRRDRRTEIASKKCSLRASDPQFMHDRHPYRPASLTVTRIATDK